MTFHALVHRATGINYFSYWPRATTTWDSVTKLNKDLHRIEPWLLAQGEEAPARCDHPAIQVRAKKVGASWMVIVLNTEPKFHSARITVEGLVAEQLPLAFAHRSVEALRGEWTERFGPFEERVYLEGREPR